MFEVLVMQVQSKIHQQDTVMFFFIKKQVQDVKYLRIVITNDGIFETEIRKFIRLANQIVKARKSS